MHVIKNTNDPFKRIVFGIQSDCAYIGIYNFKGDEAVFCGNVAVKIGRVHLFVK